MAKVGFSRCSLCGGSFNLPMGTLDRVDRRTADRALTRIGAVTATPTSNTRRLKPPACREIGPRAGDGNRASAPGLRVLPGAWAPRLEQAGWTGPGPPPAAFLCGPVLCRGLRAWGSLPARVSAREGSSAREPTAREWNRAPPRESPSERPTGQPPRLRAAQIGAAGSNSLQRDVRAPLVAVDSCRLERCEGRVALAPYRTSTSTLITDYGRADGGSIPNRLFLPLPPDACARVLGLCVLSEFLLAYLTDQPLPPKSLRNQHFRSESKRCGS